MKLVNVNDVYALFDNSGRANLHVSDIDQLPRIEVVDEIKIMVSGTKQTIYNGQIAWTVPNGQCTTNFNFACKCWKYFLNGHTSDWRYKALTNNV